MSGSSPSSCLTAWEFAGLPLLDMLSLWLLARHKPGDRLNRALLRGVDALRRLIRRS